MAERFRVLLGLEPGDFANSLRARLAGQGCDVEAAGTTAEVLSIAGEAYDTILLDLSAPELDGLAALRNLKSSALAVGCPVILMAGGDEPVHLIQRGLDLGAAACLMKDRVPITFSIATLLESFRPQSLRGDSCPHSAAATFHQCPAFMPINAIVHLDAGLERVSCSHLRPGDAGGWLIYPRCAIGDALARNKYARDQSS